MCHALAPFCCLANTKRGARYMYMWSINIMVYGVNKATTDNFITGSALCAKIRGLITSIPRAERGRRLCPGLVRATSLPLLFLALLRARRVSCRPYRCAVKMFLSVFGQTTPKNIAP